MISILFCVDSDPSSGAGHVVRSCRLATEFQRFGCKVSFTTNSGLPLLNYLPEIKSLNVIEFDSTQKYDLIVVDNYSLAAEHHAVFYKQTDKILVLDDLCDRPLICDFLWDPTITRRNEEYCGKVSDKCRLFLGGKYQIFSDYHIKTAMKCDLKSRLSSDAIHFYGGQTKNLDLASLCAALSGVFKINVLGDMCKNVSNLPATTAVTELSLNPIETFLDCRIGVGSPGNMLWERGSVGIPSYVLVNNSNQKKICSDLHEADLLELGSENYATSISNEVKNIEKLYNNSAKLHKMSRNLLKKINLQGKHLLVDKIMQEII